MIAIRASVTTPFRVDVAGTGGRHLAPLRGIIKLVWVPSFASTDAGTKWLVGLSAAAGLRFAGDTDDAIEIFSGGARVAATAGQTWVASVTPFVVSFTWTGAATQLSIVKDGAIQSAVTGVWTAPSLGSDVYIGSDSAQANPAPGAYQLIQVGG